jgi:cytoskeletal protein CcmA (bactofilin family)
VQAVWPFSSTDLEEHDMSIFGTRRQGETGPQQQQQNVQRFETQTPAPVSQQQPVGFETVLGANSSLEGALKSGANVRLDGAFNGTLEISGNVLVGETAKIQADINARNISIAGAVRGNVNGRKVQILRTGRVWGDISAQALTTEEGAFIDGKITMTGHEASSPQSLVASTEPDPEPPLPATESDTPDEDGEDEDRIIEDIAPVGLGATEEDIEPHPYTPADQPAEMDSDAPLGGEAEEGQRDTTDVDDDDVRQST